MKTATPPLATAIAKVKFLTADEEIDLASRARSGDKAAREKLIERNIPFAIKLANRMLPSCVKHHHDDLIGAAMLGLVKAADKFDPDKGRFSTCAGWWIRQSLMLFVQEQSRLVRVPRWAQDAMGNGDRARKARSCEKGRETIRMAERALRFHPVGMSGTFSNDDTWAEIAAMYDPEGRTEPEGADPEELDRMKVALACLAPKQAAVVRMRYGLDGASPMSLEAIGKKMGVSREWARLLHEMGLGNLRKAMTTDNHGRLECAA